MKIEKLCPAPPFPSSDGGYDWQGDGDDPAEYGTKVEYFCAEGKKFQDSDGQLYDFQVIECGWDERWTPSLNVNALVWKVSKKAK